MPGYWNAHSDRDFEEQGAEPPSDEGENSVLVLMSKLEAAETHIAESRARHAKLINTALDLLDALKGVVADVEDYERVNNLAPNPGKPDCWQSVTRAKAMIAKAEARLPKPA